MPQIDMQLDQLHTYTGSSPLPEDFDVFWDKALEELAQVPPNVTIEEADFQVPFAKCYHLYFTGTKGARIHAKLVKPMGLLDGSIKDKVPGVVKFHGYTMNAGDWSGLLNYAASGMIVAAMDCRGQGGLSEDVGGVQGGTLYGFIVKGVQSGPNELYYKHVFLDTARLAGIILDMEEVDASRVYACGGSQGGALTIACGALEPRVSKLAPVYPFLSDYRRIWDMDWDDKAYIGIRDYFRRFDPTHDKVDEFFHTLAYVDIQNLAKRIKGKVVMYTGLMDDVCPPSTQFAAFNKITSPKDLVIYPDFSHEHLPGQSDKELKFFLD